MQMILEGNLELLGIIAILCGLIVSMGNTPSEQLKTFKTTVKNIPKFLCRCYCNENDLESSYQPQVCDNTF